MCDSKCGGGSFGGCTVSLIGKILLIVGGINWGLVGVGILIKSDLNVIHMLLNSVPVIEGIIYVLVGIAAVVNIFGCKCKKCTASCDSCESSDAQKTV